MSEILDDVSRCAQAPRAVNYIHGYLTAYPCGWERHPEDLCDDIGTAMLRRDAKLLQEPSLEVLSLLNDAQVLSHLVDVRRVLSVA